MAELLTVDERETMRALLDYTNPQGLHPSEERWRDFSRVELSLRDERIRQLERQCASLAAEVDRMRPVVHAVRPWRRTFEIYMLDTIVEALDTYEASNPK